MKPVTINGHKTGVPPFDSTVADTGTFVGWYNIIVTESNDEMAEDEVALAQERSRDDLRAKRQESRRRRRRDW